MDDIIPRVWLERDPRNPRHIAAALRLIMRLSPESFMTRRTSAELRALGISPKMRVARPSNMDAVIGGFFFLDVGKIFPDNVLVTCAKCRTALQIRPHANFKVPKLCCFCAVDAMLTDYHAKSKE